LASGHKSGGLVLVLAPETSAHPKNARDLTRGSLKANGTEQAMLFCSLNYFVTRKNIKDTT
jgi:hypothetical protein